MTDLGFLFPERKRDIPGLLNEVRKRGDVFTHDVLYEILVRYGYALVVEKRKNEELAARIHALEMEVFKAVHGRGRITRKRSRS